GGFRQQEAKQLRLVQFIEQGGRQSPSLLDFVGGGRNRWLDGLGSCDHISIAGQFSGSRNQHDPSMPVLPEPPPLPEQGSRVPGRSPRSTCLGSRSRRSNTRCWPSGTSIRDRRTPREFGSGERRV